MTNPTPVAAILKCPKTGKRSFPDEASALAFEESNRRAYNSAQQFSYACEDCDAYHLTTRPPGTFASVHYDEAKVPASGRFARGEIYNKVVELHAKGVAPKDIAAQIGVTVASVYYHLRPKDHAVAHKQSVTLQQVTDEETALQHKLDGNRRTKERLLEQTRMKYRLADDKYVITKNNESVTLDKADITTLYQQLQP